MQTTIEAKDWWSGLDEFWKRALRESAGFDADDDLTAPSESQLERLLGVEVLQLNDQGVTSIEAVRPLRKLRVLDVGRSRVETVEPLSEHTELEELDISVSRVVDLSPLSGLSRLAELNAANTLVMELGPLATCRALVKLHLGQTFVADINPLRALEQLRELNLSDTFVRSLEPLYGLGLTSLKAVGSDADEVELIAFARQNPDAELEPPVDVDDDNPAKPWERPAELSSPGEWYTSLSGYYKYLMSNCVDVEEGEAPTDAECANMFELEELDLDRHEWLGDLSPLEPLKRLRVLRAGGAHVKRLDVLATLPLLEELDLSECRARDLAPLGALERLRVLSLAESPVHDLRPLAGARALETLNLEDTWVTSLAGLEGLGELQELLLTRSRLEHIDGIRGAKRLSSLSLRQTRVTDIAALSELPELATLNLTETPVVDLAPLAGLEKLETLELGSSEALDWSVLAKLPRLRKLSVSGAFDDATPLAEVPTLEELDASNSKLTNLRGLEGHPSLRTLNVNDTPIADLTPLAALKNLEAVFLKGTRVSYGEVKAFRAAQPNVNLKHDYLEEEEAELEAAIASAMRLQRAPGTFKDVFEEFLGLVEKSTGRSRLDLGFRPPASEEEIAKMEAELRGDSDEGEWYEKVGERGLDDLKAMLRVTNGHTKQFGFLSGPLLDAQSVVSEYLEMLKYAPADDADRYDDDETLRDVCMHEYWIPFASYTAEVTFLIDFDPGPSGQRGQVLVNYGFEDRVVICDSLTELFGMVNQALRDRTLKFGPVKGYEQKYDLLTATGKMARLDQLLGKVRGG